MAMKFKCDICGKDTELHPPSEVKTVKVKEIVRLPVQEVVQDSDGNKVMQTVVKEMEVEVDRPEMTTFRRQDHQTGNIIRHTVPKGVPLCDKTMLIYLSLGDESIKKDFCFECYNEHLKPACEDLWDRLEAIKSK